jgi:N-acetylglucosamine-6-phosphate deacetylase
MSTKALIAARILSGGRWYDDHALLIEAGHVAAIVPADQVPAHCEGEPVPGGILLPGFIDTQVNGGGGVLFNDHPTRDGIAAISAAHRRFGTTALLPTLISDDLDVIARAIGAVDEAILSAVPGVIGIHIEGPFLNPAKHGIHNATKFRMLDERAVELLSSLRGGKTLITLAPECAAPGMIASLVARGCIVAAGHSMASYEDMERAVAEGLSGVTHLYNAMTQLGSREPGLVGAAIDLGLVSGIIVDGYHVHPAALRAALRAKGKHELMLVTDAMPSVGQAAAGFALGDTWISNATGALRGPDGTLAGSDLDMARALRNAVTMMKVDVATASEMASGTPAAFLELTSSFGNLAPGQRADIVHLDDTMTPQTTWIKGEKMLAH